jgi:hypothetical protein
VLVAGFIIRQSSYRNMHGVDIAFPPARDERTDTEPSG